MSKTNKSFWDEVPSGNGATPRAKVERSSDFRFDTKWFFAILLIISLLIIGIIINRNQAPDINTGISTLEIDNGDTKINWERYSTTNIELSDSLTIGASGIYHITGSLEDGSILINAGSEGVVKLILDDVSIKNSTGPAINCIAGDDLIIELVGENYLEDGVKYSTDLDQDINGTIYSKADLTFDGAGELVIAANYQDGIVSKDDLKFNHGTYEIAAVDDGIRGKDSVYIVSGTFKVKSKGDSIKSTNETEAGKGFVLIENGNLNLESGDDTIHAIHTLIIQNGTINIAKSYEGLEAQNITINNGDISIIASDDGINAGGNSTNTDNQAFAGDENCELTVNGGNIYINTSGDGIDSNGYIYFNDGKIVVDGPTNNGNGALDSGFEIAMNGGEVIAVGSSGMAKTLGSASSVYNISVYFTNAQSANTEIKIKNSNDETIIEHISAKAFNHLSAGTTYFKLGETYTIYLNDVEYQTFTISNIVTTIGDSHVNNTILGPQNRRK